METVRIVYKGGLRTEATHVQSGTVMYTDAPSDNHGKGEAFSPTDLLAASLAECMLTIMGISAQTHKFNIDGTRAKLTKVMAANPRRVAEIIVELQFPPNNYTEKEKKLIELCAKECPVANSLHPELKQTVIFNY